MGLKEDRVTAAMLDGTAARVRAWPDQDAALAELHAITRDQRPLDLAAAGYVDSERWGADECLALLVQAGADLDEARRLKAAQGPGWTPPQATPERDRST